MNNKKYLLIGNPNVGKTSIYNKLTQSNERISNFEGVTLAKKVGQVVGTDISIVDLPGISNLNDNSTVANIIINELINTKSKNITYVADVNNIKKSLYLLIDILETNINTNVFLNMSDLFIGKIDIEKFNEIYNVQSLLVNKNDNINMIDFNFIKNRFKIEYHLYIEELIDDVQKNIIESALHVDKRFLALQLIKGSSSVIQYFNNIDDLKEKIKIVESKIIQEQLALSITGLIFKNRRDFINESLTKCYKKAEIKESKLSKTFDKLALHYIGGYFLFAFIMWLIFLISSKFVFLADYVDIVLSYFSSFLDIFLNNIGTPIWLHSFLIDGVMAGFSSVVVFLPQIIILFTLLTILESSGYLLRVSALFENLFNKLGLSSYSLIPLISGLGCNVLGIMATRTIKVESKKVGTILASPFISCSARLPVYLIFVQIFFVNYQALILLILYLLGILVALMVAIIVDKVIYRNVNNEVVISTLPTYKIIEIKYLIKIIIKKIKGFLSKAGKLIFIGTIIIWFLMHITFVGEGILPTYTTNFKESILYFISSNLAHLLEPLGFGTVEASSSLIAAFFAKEFAISAMMVSYSSSSISQLQEVLLIHFNVASAFSFMVFTLLYIPCISTLGAIYVETKKKSIVIISVILSLGVGYVLAFISYNLISLFI